MGGAGPSPLRSALSALVILALVALAYAPVVEAGFIWDDEDYVLLNPLLVEDGGLKEIWDPSSPRNPQYYPLVFTVFRVQRALWGLDPAGYHVVNVVLHAANAVLLLFLLRRVGFPAAWLAAAVFALHPVHVESVAWITELKNVLSGLFYLLAAHAYLSFDRTGRFAWYGLSLVCFALALTAKTVTASLPIALGLLLWWRHGRLRRVHLATLAPMIALGLAMGMLTSRHEQQHVLAASGVDLAPIERVLVAGRAFWFYPWKVLWPRELAFFYERWSLSPSDPAQWLYPLAAVGAGVALLVAWRRGLVGRGPVAAVLVYAATIFPALGFVDVAPLRFAFVADHFQYLASIGTILLVAGALHAALARLAGAHAGRALAATAALLAGVLAFLTRQQVAPYHDLGTLWADTVEKSPSNPTVLNHYANWLRKEAVRSDPARRAELLELAAGHNLRALEHGSAGGEEALLALSNLAQIRFDQGRYEEALALADRALAINAGFAATQSLRGRTLWQLGRLAEAEETLLAMLRTDHDPGAGRQAWDLRRRVDDAGPYLVLGLVQQGLGKKDAARASFERAIEIDPDLYDAYLKLGDLHGMEDRLEQAADAYRRLLARDPPPAVRALAYQQLGFTQGFLGRRDDALASFDAALRCAPAEARLHQAKVEMLLALGRFSDALAALRTAVAAVADPLPFRHRQAWILATAPDAADRNGAEALAIARTLVGDPPHPLSLSVLAAAQAEQGDFDGALATARRAAGLAEEPVAGQLREQIADYTRRKPTRWRR